MKRYCLFISLLSSFVLLLSLSAFAQFAGDVTVKVNGSATGPIYVGEDNVIEFWLTNNAKLKGMSLGFSLTNAGALPFSIVPGYGALPCDTFDICGCGTAGPGPQPAPLCAIPCVDGLTDPFPTTKYFMEHGNFVNTFGPCANNFSTGGLPGTLLFGGASVAALTDLPIHAASTLAYSIKINIPAGQPDLVGAFCIDNVFVPPAGSWKIDKGGVGGAIPPTFQGVSLCPTGLPQTSADPCAPAVCWDRVTRPCNPVTFTSTPGAAVNKNHCNNPAYTFDFDATTALSDLPISWSSNVGSIDGNGNFTLAGAHPTCGTTDVTVTATNFCLSFATHPFTITWTNNSPTITNCVGAGGVVGMGNTFSRDFNSLDADPCDGAVWSVAQTGGNPAVGTFLPIGGNGEFDFNTVTGAYPLGDGGETYEFTVTVTDPCGAFATCTFEVEVLLTQPFIIKIDKTHNSLQGHFEYVCIRKIAGSEQMGGFDFLIGYDNSALSFFSATLGAALGPNGCGWEYFTYRYGAFGNCGGPCPSGKLRVVAIADQNNGANHPSCYQVADGECLVELKFYVTNDRTFECQYVPIRFCWFDCGDNGISSRTGDTLFISSKVFEFQNTDPLNDPNYEITGLDCGMPFHFGGACPDCDVSQKYRPVRFIIFWNGGIDIVCADSIDARGDLNLNGIANEIADAVLYTNFFLYGMGALDPLFFDAQIAASDVNADGVPLSVGDLVYLLRIIVGDALPFPKLAPFANSATINVAQGMVSSESATDLGAVYATFTVKGAYDVVNHSNMELVSAENNSELRVLVYSGMTNMTNRIEAGSNELFSVNGDVELKNVEVSDYNGSLLTTSINKNTLPTSYALLQNVPNPFNPTTKIGLNLPVPSDWSLDIYNVAGQLVESFKGHGVGNITVNWTANAASGIYFYKATAGSFTDTKKMVLMK
jgi:hypothetical protein